MDITLGQAKEYMRKLGRLPTLQDIQRRFKANYNAARRIQDVLRGVEEVVVYAQRNKRGTQ